MALVIPSQGFIKATLRFQFKQRGWSEEYHLGNLGDDDALKTLNALCDIRSTWLGLGASIVYASYSDMGSGRDGEIADGLPYVNPYLQFTGLGAWDVGDPATCYQYRLQTVNAYKQYRVFRGLPGRDVLDLVPITDAWLGNAPLNAGGIYTSGGQFGYPPPPGGNLGQQYSKHANGLLNFLVQKTAPMHFNAIAGTWALLGTWAQIPFRRVTSRRCGHVFARRKGRFQRF